MRAVRAMRAMGTMRTMGAMRAMGAVLGHEIAVVPRPLGAPCAVDDSTRRGSTRRCGCFPPTCSNTARNQEHGRRANEPTPGELALLTVQKRHR